ncbi:DNA replication terminus site-binding protein [Pseudoalteromonas luteoviolacea]|uniref:DNA replication terminus site-binding protein n=1 Tax=Pseudoalteromonas luteoviolacea TaxID=43657 RepID=A0A1C0TRD6_9GAMM|nr:DNA replication terminus site-binding protein [Pseudoalteromonas luteoviolacea]OCQ21522.1 DNA replication terminus site-binding protein [Pseudoalteromonas luteoviolacea]
MSSKFNLRSTFDYLFDQINILCEEIKHADVVSCRYYLLPEVTEEDEKKAPDNIPVSKVTGEDALDKCLNGYKDVFVGNKKSGKILTRHPGIISINDPDLSLKARLVEVNKAKQSFKESILEINNNDARFEAVHNAVPNLITLAAYRKIHFEDAIPYSVRFTWMKKHSSLTLSKKEALEMLNKSSGYSNPRVIDQQNWMQIVESEKLRVGSLNEKSKLRIKRPTRVTPEVNIRFTAKNRYHVSAALPFILLNPQQETKIGALTDYSSSNVDVRKKDYSYLIERIYLENLD